MTFQTLRLKPSVLALGSVLVLGSVWCLADWYVALPAGSQASFVGGEACMRCHEASWHTWRGSDHDRAMEIANEDSVLGDFDNTEFTRNGVTTRFFRQDDKFMVNTEGPDGQMHDYEIKYTFGVDPLQQYMVEFPGGRLQVLTVSWDVNRHEWFMVTPPDVPDERILPGDPLHWTGLAQNWNTMCAECHSTNLQKNYDLASDSYHTTYSDIDVSCEACHGPGSLHVQLAESHSLFWDRRFGYGLKKLKQVSNAEQLDTCAPCHSRRAPIHVDTHDTEKYLDHFSPALLDRGLYYPDGQILDEVYVWGSFLQSKMYSKGVRCTDCHNPHSLQLKYEGNRLCAQCHQPGKYDTPNHHRHTSEAASQCVTCHMPAQNYMVLDERQDHSFRIPRPDLSIELGTPNTCNHCHDRPEETASWAAQAIRMWYGDKRPDDPHYGPAFYAAQHGKPEGLEMLRDLLQGPPRPDIVRATAVRLLGGYGNEESDRLCRNLLDDESPLVRSAAVDSLSQSSLESFINHVARRLYDSIRLVRFAAARRIVSSATKLLESFNREALDRAVAEYREGLQVVLDRAATHLNLAALNHALGDDQAARNSLRTAIRLEPYLTGPRDQLAQLLETEGGDPAEIRRLREEEIKNLTRDAELLPTSAPIRYRRGMLLYLVGRPKAARQAFERACALQPSFDNWLALALICEQLRDWDRAAEALDHMEALRPDEPMIRGIRDRIEQTRAGK